MLEIIYYECNAKWNSHYSNWTENRQIVFIEKARKINQSFSSFCQNASTCHIAQKAFGVLMNTMNMHPPTSALMQSVYLSTFRSGQDDSSAGMVWNYISHVIRSDYCLC